MKKTTYVSLIAFLLLMGCSKSANDLSINQEENQLKSINGASLSARTATPISSYATQQYWDNNDVLQTSLWYPLKSYTAPPGYPVYVASNYDVMCHFQYFSKEAVSGAVVEFTFPHIIDFVPHMLYGRTYTANNADNITVISCTTDLIAGWNPMFCFMVKVDCDNGNNGLTTIWTDMKVNGVSVKGTIKNKVFDCN